MRPKARTYQAKYKGNDNYSIPKSQYVAKIITMTDDELYEECKSKRWLSAYANNNPRSDYHWHVDVIWDECQCRKGNIYARAESAVYKKHGLG